MASDMFGVRTAARSLLASMFVIGGVEALRRPDEVAPAAEDVADPVADRTGIDTSAEELVKINGAVQVAGGVMLITGFFPRVAAIALGASLVPTTLAAHRFWEEEGDERTRQLIHFCKNAGLLGGLLFAALDTGGRPSVFWAGRRMASDAIDAIGSGAASAYETVSPS